MAIPLADPSAILFLKLCLAVLLGAFIGAERVAAGNKGAGIRTFALVSLGSCLFVIISTAVSSQYIGLVNFDPMHMAANIITGIGFLGAGLIFMREDHVRGLTTAAAMWCAAAVGASVGFGLYAIAIFTSLLILFIFTALWFVEEKLRVLIRTWDKRGVDMLDH